MANSKPPSTKKNGRARRAVTPVALRAYPRDADRLRGPIQGLLNRLSRSPFPEVLELENDVRTHPTWGLGIEHYLVRLAGLDAGIDELAVVRLLCGYRDPREVVNHCCCPPSKHHP